MQTDLKGRETWFNKLSRILNSAACFAIAYIVLTQFFWFTMGLVGKFFKFDSFVYYYGIKFMLHEHYWNRLNVSLIYTSGSIACLLLGLLSLFLYDKVKHLRKSISLLLLWGFVIGSSIFCAQALVASLGHGQYNSPYYQNFAVVFAWLRFPAPVVYLLNIPFAVLLVYFSVNSGVPFLTLAYSYTKVNKLSRRRRFYFETLIIPFLIGALVSTVVTFPMNIFVHAVYLGTIAVYLAVGWYALSYVEVLKDSVLKYKGLQTLSPYLLFVLALVIAAVVVSWAGVYLSYN